MSARYTNLSADSHLAPLWYPADLYTSRLPEKFQEAAPRVVETEKGTMWGWEGELHGEAADGNDWEKHAKNTFRASREPDAPVYKIPHGKLASDASVMLEHMDMDGTYAGVYYGNTRKPTYKDPELEKACYAALNDWAVETSSVARDRIIILPSLPVSFAADCAAEVYRLAKKGAKAVELVLFDVEQPVLEEVWDPVWAAAAETGLVICSHVGDAKGVPYPEFRRGARLAHYPMAPMSIAPHLPKLIFSGVFERYPTLQYSFAECRIGWLPFFIQWMDRTAQQRGATMTDTKLSLLPSEYIKRQVTFTFEEDFVGGLMLREPRYYIQDSAVWGSDYPHEQGTWPFSEKILDEIFAGADPQLRQTIVWDRTAKAFNIEGPKDATNASGRVEQAAA
ncbi:MAG: amidohydrolase family protein [Chloroflexota bacterium]